MTKAHILIVDDEEDIRELIAYNLRREGYGVTAAESGEQALSEARRHPPELVILDLMLPGVDGLEVCRLMKANSRTAGIPIVMLTAKGEEADVVAGLEVGADDYVIKPFSPRVLLARIKAVLALCMGLVFSAAALAAGTTIQIKGSDTMVNLMSNLAKAYMKAHPDASIAVTGSGSGTGIAALINGTTDICAASRLMKKEEIDQAVSRSVTPEETIVGLDGIAVMVNKKNPVSELTLEQLKNIYTGVYTRWSDVGGPDQPIIVLSRESNSGTYVYFQEHVLEKKDYAPTVRLMPSTAAITKSVTDDQWAIGYGGVAYAEHADVKTIHVKTTPGGPAVAPSEATVHDGSYPISRPLFLYTNGQAARTIKDFIDYCKSPEGQGIVTETGYITVQK